MNGYKKGDIVICRDNCHFEDRLTINEKYCILTSTRETIIIFDNLGEKRQFHLRRFDSELDVISELDIILSVIKKEIYESSKT